MPNERRFGGDDASVESGVSVEVGHLVFVDRYVVSPATSPLTSPTSKGGGAVMEGSELL